MWSLPTTSFPVGSLANYIERCGHDQSDECQLFSELRQASLQRCFGRFRRLEHCQRARHQWIVFRKNLAGVDRVAESPLPALRKILAVHSNRQIRVAVGIGLQIAFAGAAKRGQDLFARPICHFSVGLATVLFLASLSHAKAVFPVNLVMTAVFTVQAFVFRERRLIIGGILGLEIRATTGDTGHRQLPGVERRSRSGRLRRQDAGQKRQDGRQIIPHHVSRITPSPQVRREASR